MGNIFIHVELSNFHTSVSLLNEKRNERERERESIFQ